MLEEYRRDYVDFNTSLIRETYLYQSGRKQELELGAIYDRFGDLCSWETAAKLNGLLEETPAHFETDRASIRRLRHFAIDQLITATVRDLTEAISQYETGSYIEWAGRQMTFHDSLIAISTESDRESRRALFNRRMNFIESSNPVRSERLRRIHQTAQKIWDEILTGGVPAPAFHLAYAATNSGGQNGAADRQADVKQRSSYKSLYQALLGIDWNSLAREAENFLDQTEAVCAGRLDETLKLELGFGADEAERHDALYFFNITRFDRWFAPERLLRVYEQTMSGLGIQVGSQANIEIDTEPRPHKTSRAFCAPIAVPGEVKLVIKPVGGHADYLTFFHEVGHAQHYGWTSSTLTPEFKHSGDYGLSETYAFLFNHLPTESSWLETFCGLPESNELIFRTMLAKLVTVRRYAAKFICEYEMHEHCDLSRAADRYSDLQTIATRFSTGATEFLYDLDDAFYSASYLRAWAFEVSLRDYLKHRYGSRWWSNRLAGNFLKEIWETGDRYTADEMADQIGIGPITFEPLIDEFISAMATFNGSR